MQVNGWELALWKVCTWLSGRVARGLAIIALAGKRPNRRSARRFREVHQGDSSRNAGSWLPSRDQLLHACDPYNRSGRSSRQFGESLCRGLSVRRDRPDGEL